MLASQNVRVIRDTDGFTSSDYYLHDVEGNKLCSYCFTHEPDAQRVAQHLNAGGGGYIDETGSAFILTGPTGLVLL